jgi:DNA repair protein SbcC/Rad50
MWIRKVVAGAFGALRDRELELAPGLTVVHGENESAKSTWHAALTVGLCGRRRGAGRSSADADFEARHRPWDLEETWSVGVELQLDDGRRIEIDRDLHRQRSQVVDIGLGGRPVADDLMRDGSPDASVWVGLDRASFSSTAGVRQAEILSVNDEPGALMDFLGRAAASAGGSESAASAMERVVRFRKENVGSDRVNAVKPLRIAMNNVAAAQAELGDARRVHADYLAAAAQAEQYRGHLSQLEQRLAAIRLAQSALEVDVAQVRFDRLSEWAERCPDNEPVAPLSTDLAPLLAAHAQMKALRAPAALDTRPIDVIEGELLAVPVLPEGPMLVDSETEASVACWHSESAQLSAWRSNQPAPAVDGPAPGDVRVLADRIQQFVERPTADLELELAHLATERVDALSAATDRTRLRVTGAVVSVSGLAAVALAFAAGLGAAFAVLGGILLVLGALLVRRPAGHSSVLMRNVERAEAIEVEIKSRRVHNAAVEASRIQCFEQLKTWGLSSEPATAVAMAEDQAAATERAKRWHRELADRAEALEQASTLAHALLDQYTDRSGDPAVRLNNAHSRCEELRVVEQASRASVGLEAELARSREYAAAHERFDADRNAAIDQLLAVAAQFGLSGPIHEVVSRIPALLAQREVEQADHDRRRTDWVRLQERLGGLTLDEHRRRLDVLANEHRLAVDACADNPVRLDFAHDVAAVDEAAAATEDRLRRAREAAATAQGRLDQLRVTCPDVAIAEAVLLQAESGLERVELLHSTLDHTERFLERAQEQAHRMLAPQLESEVTRWMAPVTGGRYDRARVDPETLQMRLRESTGRWRDASLVSHGTAEQVHLVLRVVLAKILTRPHEQCPLILDDPTVHADARRKIEMLEFLREVSRETQVIVFSQEAQVIEWAAERLDPVIDRSISLIDGPDTEADPVDESGAIPLPGSVA